MKVPSVVLKVEFRQSAVRCLAVIYDRIELRLPSAIDVAFLRPRATMTMALHRHLLYSLTECPESTSPFVRRGQSSSNEVLVQSHIAQWLSATANFAHMYTVLS
jgi:hypothetical protein